MTNSRLFPIFLGISLFAASCQDVNDSKNTPATTDSATTTTTGTEATTEVMKGIVKQSMQTTNYTYILFTVNGADQWVAVPAQQVKEGETYYFRGGLTMSNFESKELKRTFDNILFLERLSTDEESAKVAKQPGVTSEEAQGQHTMAQVPEENSANQSMPSDYKRTPPSIEKKSIKIDPVSGGITVAELYKNKAKYAGKVVKIKGEVTKFTPAVMNKNWLHIQDGSENVGKFDLVVTTGKEVKVGDKVVIEGKISLDKDLGYGYFFDVIMEDAVVK